MSPLQFQSHNGAIAAFPYQPFVQEVVSFNPTMVRLLQRHLEFLAQVIRGFNPTMVRLLPDQVAPTLSDISKFQSHNGAIAASSC